MSEQNQELGQHLDLERSRLGLEAVLKVCKRPGRILILTQNNPDPDAIASAAALREIIWGKLRKRSVIGYGGVCGRAENRAMLDVLRIEAHAISSTGMNQYKTICLVDTQPFSGNNALLRSQHAHVVIDHHIIPKKAQWTADFYDVRTHYGATSTILYEYLLLAEIPAKDPLATALFYGIQSDTQDLGRETCPADIEASQRLFAEVDPHKLARIRRAPVAPEYFLILRDSLERCVVAGNTVITSVESSDNPDVFAEIADRMLRLENIRMSVCYGHTNGTVYISARATDSRSNAALCMRKTVAHVGTGGGHRTMAGGQVPIKGDRNDCMRDVYERILKHFARGNAAQPLLPNAELPFRPHVEKPLAEQPDDDEDPAG